MAQRRGYLFPLINILFPNVLHQTHFPCCCCSSFSHACGRLLQLSCRMQLWDIELKSVLLLGKRRPELQAQSSWQISRCSLHAVILFYFLHYFVLRKLCCTEGCWALRQGHMMDDWVGEGRERIFSHDNRLLLGIIILPLCHSLTWFYTVFVGLFMWDIHSVMVNSTAVWVDLCGVPACCLIGQPLQSLPGAWNHASWMGNTFVFLTVVLT